MKKVSILANDSQFIKHYTNMSHHVYFVTMSFI